MVFVSVNVSIESSHTLLKTWLKESDCEISFQFPCEFSFSSYSG